MTAQTVKGEERVQAEVASLVLQNSRMLVWSERSFQVLDDVQRNSAENLLIGIREAEKAADKKRREILVPLDEARSRVQGLFKPYLDDLAKARVSITQGLTIYHGEQQKAAEEAKNLLLQEQAERIAEAKKQGEIVEPTAFVPGELPDVAKTSHADMGRVTYREDIEVMVVDVRLIPRDLMMPDLPRIKARLKSGAEVPGVVAVKKYITIAKGSG